MKTANLTAGLVYAVAERTSSTPHAVIERLLALAEKGASA